MEGVFMRTYNELTLIKVKDISELLSVTERTAGEIYRDIKKEYSLKRVLYKHLKQYLKF